MKHLSGLWYGISQLLTPHTNTPKKQAHTHDSFFSLAHTHCDWLWDACALIQIIIGYQWHLSSKIRFNFQKKIIIYFTFFPLKIKLKKFITNVSWIISMFMMIDEAILFFKIIIVSRCYCCNIVFFCHFHSFVDIHQVCLDFLIQISILMAQLTRQK